MRYLVKTDTPIPPGTYELSVALTPTTVNAGESPMPVVFKAMAPGTPVQPVPPGKVVGLTATAVSASQINLAWNPLAGASAYKIMRGAVALGPLGTTAFADTGLNPSTNYSYVVTGTNAVGDGIPSDPANATTQAGGGAHAIKWFPGHYMGSNDVIRAGDPVSSVYNETDKLNNLDLVLGYLCFISWGAWEVNKDDYSVGDALIDALIARLQTAYNKPKRLAIKLVFAEYNNTKTNSGLVPNYVLSNPIYGQAGSRVGGVTTIQPTYGWWGGDGNGNTASPCTHRTAIRDRLILFLQHVCARYNNHPAVECVNFDENSIVIGACSVNACPDFSQSATQNNWLSILQASTNASPNMTINYENTYFGDATSTQKYMDSMYQARVVPSITDFLGQTYMDAHAGSPLSWGAQAYVGIKNSGSTWIPTDYRPLTAFMPEVEGADMGAYHLCPGGPPGGGSGYTAPDLLTALNTCKATHAFWGYIADTIPGPPQPSCKWSALGPFLNNPANALASTRYPPNYP